jgi:hypothetical protein
VRDDTTELSFSWLVGTPKRWMSFLAPIARPAFSWNHDHMMSAFGVGSARAAGTRVPGFQVMPEDREDR